MVSPKRQRPRHFLSYSSAICQVSSHAHGSGCLSSMSIVQAMKKGKEEGREFSFLLRTSSESCIYSFCSHPIVNTIAGSHLPAKEAGICIFS